MKKRSIILALVFALVFVFAACSDVSGGSSDGPHNDTAYNERSEYTGGVHRFNVSERNSYILKDGATDYKVVVSASAKKDELSAASEFAKFFK